MSRPLFCEANATEAVVSRHANAKDVRLRHIADVLVRHLHEAVREIEPTREEWALAIDFLTRTGRMCTDRRQEFILLSDVLGVSMLVDAINHRREGGGTESTVLGPFHVDGAPLMPMGASICRDGRGEPMLVAGRVCGRDGAPVAGAELDVWQAAPSGRYDVQDDAQPAFNLRGRFRTGADGAFRFRTVKPAPYPIPVDGTVGPLLEALGRHPFRPAHVHFMIGAPGFRTLVTHLFLAGDPYLDADAVFGVKESLVVEPSLERDPATLREAGLTQPCAALRYEFRLAPAPAAAGIPS